MTPLPSYSRPLRRDRRAQARIRALHHLALAGAVAVLGLALAHTALKTALDVQHMLASATAEGPLK